MASSKSKNGARLRAGTPVLITECVDEFVALRKALYDEIRPNGLIEERWVDDLACVMWEITRLLRIKAGILNGAFCEALQDVSSRSGARILKIIWRVTAPSRSWPGSGLRTTAMRRPRSPSCSANINLTRPRSRHRRFACAPRISKN